MTKIGRKSKIFKLHSVLNDTTKWGNFNESKLNLENCQNTLLDKFEILANQFATGWKYHISNTDGIKEAWNNFENFYTEICLLAVEREIFSTINEINASTTTTTKLLLNYTISDRYRTVEQCDELLAENVNELASKLSPNWKNVIRNINDNASSKAWKDFEHYFQQICSQQYRSKFVLLFFCFASLFISPIIKLSKLFH